MSDTRALNLVCRACTNGHHSSRTACRLTAPGGIPCECGTCPSDTPRLGTLATALRYEFTEAERQSLYADTVTVVGTGRVPVASMEPWGRVRDALAETLAADVAPLTADLLAATRDGAESAEQVQP